jgi:hypothetical protein
MRRDARDGNFGGIFALFRFQLKSKIRLAAIPAAEQIVPRGVRLKRTG